MNTLLITDLDNTLYNWIDYFGMSFRGMTHAISREMGIEEDLFINGAKEVFKRVGTLEYAFLIQELPFINNYSKADVNKYIELSKKVFSRVRKKNLNPYQGVRQTLDFLVKSGVTIVAVTNAPIYYGEARLKQLYLDRYFYGIVGWEGKEVPKNEYTEIIRENIKNRKYESKYIKKRWTEPKENIKPNPIGYLKVLSHLMVSHKNTYIIGDSLDKDIIPANEIGAISIWAKYGTVYDKKNLNTLLSITHWDGKKIKKEYERKEIKPKFEVDSFSELQKIIKGPQLRLFQE